MLNKKSLLTLLCLFAFGITKAQTIKNCDISVAITNPANNTIVPYGDTIMVSFSYTNNGPDVLPAGDTLFFATAAGILYSKLLIDLQINSTILMDDALMFWNPSEDSLSGDICVMHIPQESVQYTTGSIATKTYNDPDTTNDLGCVFITFNGLQDTTTSIPNLILQNPLISLYPNPAKDLIHFSLNKEIHDSYLNVLITDIQGRIIITKKLPKTLNNKYSIDISNLKDGTYFIKLQGFGASDNLKGKIIISK